MSVSEFAQSSVTAPADPPVRTRVPARDGWAALLVVAVLTLAGAVIRLVVAGQPLFADELSTYWISATHSLGGVMSLMYGTGAIKHAEITPPMYFVLAWAAMHLGHSQELLRLPSLVAGIATLPLVYALGLRTVGRWAAVLGTAVTALLPFQIYYSTEARAYGVMMFLTAASTLCLLLALERGGWRWWALYAVCSAGAFFSHYTCAFVLGAQLLWVLVFHPSARRAAILANVGAGVLLAAWVPGMLNDFRSPTTVILSDLSPFSPGAVRTDLTHWALGYPYTKLATLAQIPGRPAVVLLVGATLLALAGVALAGWRRRPALRELDRRVLLVGLLTLATPVCEAVYSAVDTHIFGVRNLASSWVPGALLFGWLVWASGRRIAPAAAALALVGLGLAGASMLHDSHQRPHYGQAADYVDAHARAGDVVIDQTGELSPGPFTAFDVAVDRPLTIVRALAPQERSHPFGLSDPYVSLSQASAEAARMARGRIFVVAGDGTDSYLSAAGFQRLTVRGWDGMYVAVFARPGAASS